MARFYGHYWQKTRENVLLSQMLKPYRQQRCKQSNLIVAGLGRFLQMWMLLIERAMLFWLLRHDETTQYIGIIW